MRFSEMSKVCWDNQTLVLPDLDLGSRKVTHPTKLGVPSNFWLIKFLPKTWLRLQNPTGPPFWASWTPGVRVGCRTSSNSY